MIPYGAALAPSVSVVLRGFGNVAFFTLGETFCSGIFEMTNPTGEAYTPRPTWKTNTD